MTVPPVVLVHGLMGAFGDRATVASIAPGARAPAMLGYGEHRDVDPATLTIARQAAHIAAVLDGLGERAVLVGHSVGGVVAAHVAHAHPERVACLVSVEGNFTLNDAFASRRFAAMDDEELATHFARARREPAAWLRSMGLDPRHPAPETAAALLDHQPPAVVRAMSRAVLDATSDDAYDALLRTVFAQTPVRLVAGARSRAGWDVPAWALACAPLVVVPRCGHMVNLDAPEAIAAVVRDAVPDAGPA